MSNQILPVVLAVGGMYLILKYGLPDVWNKLIGDINPIPPIQPPAPELTLSKSVVSQGDTFEVSVVGLKPDTPAYYGWARLPALDIVFEKKVDIGGLYAVRIPFKFTEQVTTATPGDYLIYYDQTPFGGYYLTAALKVV